MAGGLEEEVGEKIGEKEENQGKAEKEEEESEEGEECKGEDEEEDMYVEEEELKKDLWGWKGKTKKRDEVGPTIFSGKVANCYAVNLSPLLY